jgi:hypothetical protein
MLGATCFMPNTMVVELFFGLEKKNRMQACVLHMVKPSPKGFTNHIMQ